MVARTEPESGAARADGRVYVRLLQYVRPLLGAFFISTLGYLIYSASNIGFVALLQYIVDSLNGDDPLAGTAYAEVAADLLGAGEQLNRAVIPAAMIMIVIAMHLMT